MIPSINCSFSFFLGCSMAIMNETLDHDARSNGTITALLAKHHDDYNAAVGGRLQEGGTADEGVCRGYTGYWCYLAKDATQTREDYMTGQLEIKKCTDTEQRSLSLLDGTSTSFVIESFNFYELRMVLEGPKIGCELVKETSESSEFEFVAEASALDGDFDQGSVGIAAWGTSWYLFFFQVHL